MIMRSILQWTLAAIAIALLTSCAQFNRSGVKNAAPSPSPASTVSATTRRFPSPVGLVNDYAGVIDAESKARLENLLGQLKEKSNIELAVVTIDSTNGEP